MKIRGSEPIQLPLIGNLVFSGIRPVIAIIMALIVSAVLIFASGSNPITAYGALLEGSFGSLAAVANTLVRATPLLLGGLGFAIALEAGLVNVGIEGQMYVGAAAATAIGILSINIPAWLHLLMAILAGFVGRRESRRYGTPISD